MNKLHLDEMCYTNKITLNDNSVKIDSKEQNNELHVESTSNPHVESNSDMKDANETCVHIDILDKYKLSKLKDIPKDIVERIKQ